MGISLNGLKAILDFNREQKPIDEDEIEKGQCPICAWTLKENKQGQKACPVCGQIYE